MWTRFINFLRGIAALIRHFLGQQPHISPDTELKPAEKEDQFKKKVPEKDLALPIGTSRYEQIDWEKNPPIYRKRNGVLTFPERQFHRLLVSIIGRNHQILSMVRMADVIYLSNETDDYKYHRNNILCKHFDFVICDKRKFEPLLIIELDDPKHQFLHRREADIFKEKACKEAGIKLLRFDMRKEYNRQEIEEKIRQELTA